MLTYTVANLLIYLDTTVVSYFAADLSDNPQVALWQRESRRFWNDYQDRFDFVVSDTVITEAGRGNVAKAQRRLDALAHLRILPMTSSARVLAQNLIAARAMPENLHADAEHIAIATVHGVAYLVSWNHKHLVNENQLRQINRVVAAAGFRPVTICTPTTFMEEFIMKEPVGKCYLPGFDPETYTDPILEECYEIKRELNAEFKSLDEFHDYLVAHEIETAEEGPEISPGSAELGSVSAPRG